MRGDDVGINKIVYGGDTLLDLTADTVDAASIAEGATAHNAAGEQIVGMCPVVAYNSAGMLLLPGYLEKRVDINSNSIDLTQGSVFFCTVSSMTVLSITGTDAITPGYAASVLLVIKMAASYPVIFPASVRWAGDMPTLENGKTYEIVLRSYDDGVSWIASSGEGADNA